MNGHDIAEHARLLSHRHYAEVIEVLPDLIEQARAAITTVIAAHGGTLGQQHWAELLREPWPQIRARMLAESAEGRLLRSNSPFSTLVGVTHPEERTRLWWLAKQELSDPTTSSARSAA